MTSESGANAYIIRWGSALYDFYDMHPEKAINFAKAMEGITRCK